jgi:hypothetical protein
MKNLSAAGWLAAVLTGLLGLAGPGRLPVAAHARDEEPDGEELKQKREARLRTMHEQVKSVSVESKSDAGWEAADLHDEPLFRYADVPRAILDASLWCWGAKGRPVALTKLEMVGPHDNFGAEWQYCMASLAEQPIHVMWSDGPPFTAAKAGVAWLPISDAPEIHDKPPARLRQMKELAKRFSATILIDGKESLKQEMRQLTSPIHRYADAERGLTDGTIFGFSTNGTNPDVLLIIEAASKKNLTPQWRFAVVGMTWSEYRVRLDEAEVYRMPFPPPRDTWDARHVPRADER